MCDRENLMDLHALVEVQGLLETRGVAVLATVRVETWGLPWHQLLDARGPITAVPAESLRSHHVWPEDGVVCVTQSQKPIFKAKLLVLSKDIIKLEAIRQGDELKLLTNVKIN